MWIHWLKAIFTSTWSQMWTFTVCLRYLIMSFQESVKIFQIIAYICPTEFEMKEISKKYL